MSDRIPRKKAHLLSQDCIGDHENEKFFAGEARCTIQLSGGAQEISVKVWPKRISKTKRNVTFAS